MVGDPWDPDVFEASLKAKEFRVRRDDDYSWVFDLNQEMLSWTTEDEYLLFLLTSSSEGSPLTLEGIGVVGLNPYGSSFTSRKIFTPLAPGFCYRKIISVDGVALGSTKGMVKGVFGKPLMTFPFLPSHEIATYLGNRQSVTFMYDNRTLYSVHLSRGYRGNLQHQLIMWRDYLYAPLRMEDIDWADIPY